MHNGKTGADMAPVLMCCAAPSSGRAAEMKRVRFEARSVDLIPQPLFVIAQVDDLKELVDVLDGVLRECHSRRRS
jgi:hypothetical protein